MVRRTQTPAKMMKTEAPIDFCRIGKVMPIMKLQNHEDKLPIDMATGRGPTSKSSANQKFHENFSFFLTLFHFTASTEERNRTQTNLIHENVAKQHYYTHYRQNI